MALLPNDEWEGLLEGLVRKKYQILLGAGFSLEVRDRLNRPLPSGNGLRDEIVNEFDLPLAAGETIDLSRACDAAKRRTSLNGQTFEEWLKFRFSETTAPTWYEALSMLPLQTIWTLNIDDAVERMDRRRFKPVTFADNHITRGSDEVVVVHLHGYAARPEKGLIFSISEYRQSVAQPRSYALQFQEALSDGPVIVIGAALHHETDLAQALRERAQNQDSRWPSIIVKPDPTQFEKDEFAAWGLTVVGTTGEHFLNDVRIGMPDAQRKLAPVLAAENANSPATMRFDQQWNRLSPSMGAQRKYRDFLSGAEPLPIDIKNKKIINRKIASSVKDLLLVGDKPVLLHGVPFCGKSTIALAVGVEFHISGWEVYQFGGDEKMDVSVVLARVNVQPHTLLLVDDAALTADSLQNLVDEASRVGVALHLLCIDRTGPASRLLRWGVFHERVLPRSLLSTEKPSSGKELQDFIELLRRNDRLNRAWRQRNDRTIYKDLTKTSCTDFASIICETVIGEQFEERVRRDYRSLDNELARGAYLLGCVLARVSKGAPVGLVAAALGATGRSVEQTVEDLATMESVCTLVNGHIRPRHRRHAELLVGKVISADEAFGPLLGLAKAVAPRLDIDAIRHETAAYRISAEILNQETLADLIGPHRLESFYSQIENAYAWNSRYWEQRALAAGTIYDFDQAIKFSDMALSAHRDAFSLNTAASIRLQSLWAQRPDIAKAQQGYWSCLPLMREARSKSRPDSEYPFVTFFSASLKLVNLIRQAGATTDRPVLKEWEEWKDAADRSLAFRDALGRTKLVNYEKRWLKIWTTDETE